MDSQSMEFRGWNGNKFIYFNLYDLLVARIAVGHGYNNFPLLEHPITRFTGLIDVNGTKIYEGDKIKTIIPGWKTEESFGIIEYADKWGTFYFSTVNPNGVGIALDTVDMWLYDTNNNVVAEVVGHLFE